MDLIDLLLNPGGSSVGSVGPPRESRRISVYCLLFSVGSVVVLLLNLLVQLGDLGLPKNDR
jgi:hypothetical protein